MPWLLPGKGERSTVLLFRYEAEPYVIRFPNVVPYPPFLLEQIPHDAIPHGHTTPHGGFVEALGDNHLELAIEDGMLRLFWYDVALNPESARGILAVCFLAPCGSKPLRIELLPVGDQEYPHYLEAAIPEPCGPASRVALSIRNRDLEKMYRYRLPSSIGELSQKRSRRLGVAEVDGVRVELRSEGSGFPGPLRMEARLADKQSLQVLDLRKAPELSLSPHPAVEIPLPRPLRLSIPGRWHAEAHLPPGEGRVLMLRFEDLDGAEKQTAFVLDLPKSRRSASAGWLGWIVLAGGLYAGLTALASRNLLFRGKVDLIEMLSLEPVLTSPFYPALIQWPFFLGFVLVLYRLFSGPQASALNPAVSFLPGLLLPAILLSPLLLARGWCAVCPFTVIIDLTRDLFGARRRVPEFLHRYRPVIIGIQLVLLPAVFLLAGLLRSSRALGYGFAVYLVIAAGMALLYTRRAFCRTACPLGAVLGALATAAPFRLEVKENVCEKDCESPLCDVGSKESSPCPLSACPDGKGFEPGSCILCGQCMKSCPHGAIAMRPRWPFMTSLKGKNCPGSASSPLPHLIAGCTFILLLSIHPFWYALGPESFSENPRWTPLLPGLALLCVLALLPLAFGALLHLASRRIFSSHRTPASLLPSTSLALVPIVYAGVTAWAVPVLLGALPHLGQIGRAILSGDRFEAALSPGLEPEATLSIQVGILCSGALLSCLSALAGAGPSPPEGSGRAPLLVPSLLLIAALTIVCLYLTATSFDLRLPVSIVSSM